MTRGIWTLTKAKADSVVGRFAGTGTGVADYMNGELVGRASGDSLHLVSHWIIPRRSCTGTFSADGVTANNGALIEGSLHVRASCGTHEEIGIFALFAPSLR